VILAGAIGDEKSSVALFARVDGGLHLLRSATVDNAEIPSLRALLRRFLAQDLTRLRAVCCGLGSAPPWPVTPSELSVALGLPEVELISEAVACAEWLIRREPEDLHPLTSGAAAAVSEGIWIGLDEEPGLARVCRGDGGLAALPFDAGSGDGILPRVCRELRAGNVLPLAGVLAAPAGTLDLAGGTLYLGGDRIRSLLPLPVLEQLREVLRRNPSPIPVLLVEKPPLPLWGAAWRALRRWPGAGEVA
jgi:hypothetical protein